MIGLFLKTQQYFTKIDLYFIAGFEISGSALKPTLPASALHKHRPITARLASSVNSSLRGSRENIHPLRRVATARRVKSARPPLGRLPQDRGLDPALGQSRWITITKYNKGHDEVVLENHNERRGSPQLAVSPGLRSRGSASRNTENTSTTTSFLPQVPVVIVKRAGLLSGRSQVGEEYNLAPVNQTKQKGDTHSCSSAESLHASSEEEEEWKAPAAPIDDDRLEPKASVQSTVSQTENHDTSQPNQWDDEGEGHPDVVVTPTKAPTAAIDPDETELSCAFSVTPSTECERNDMIRERMTASMTPAMDPSPDWPNEGEVPEEDVFLTAVPKEDNQTEPETKGERKSMVIHQVEMSMDPITDELYNGKNVHVTNTKPPSTLYDQSPGRASGRQVRNRPEDVESDDDQGTHSKEIITTVEPGDQDQTRHKVSSRRSVSNTGKSVKAVHAEEESTIPVETVNKRHRPGTGRVRITSATPYNSGDEEQEQNPKSHQRAVSFAHVDNTSHDTAGHGPDTAVQPQARPRTARVSSARPRARIKGSTQDSTQNQAQPESSVPGRRDSNHVNGDNKREPISETVESGLHTLVENPLSPDQGAVPHTRDYHTVPAHAPRPVPVARPRTSRPRTAKPHMVATYSVTKNGLNGEGGHVDDNDDGDDPDDSVVAGDGTTEIVTESVTGRSNSSRPSAPVPFEQAPNEGEEINSDVDSIPDDTNSEASDLDTTKLCTDQFLQRQRPKTGRVSTRSKPPTDTLQSNYTRDDITNSSSPRISEKANDTAEEPIKVSVKARPKTAVGPAALERKVEPIVPMVSKRPSTGTYRAKSSRQSCLGKTNDRRLSEMTSDSRQKPRPSTGNVTRSAIASGRPKTSIIRHKSGHVQHGLPPGNNKRPFIIHLIGLYDLY